MAWGHGNLGGGSNNKSMIIVSAPEDTISVVAKYADKTKRGQLKNGKWIISNLDYGEKIVWRVTATNGNESVTVNQPVSRFEIFYITLVYQYLPTFTYTGDYEVVTDPDERVLKDNNSESPEYATYKGHYKIRLLTSGKLMFKSLGYISSLGNLAEVFLVGGGAGTSPSWSVNFGAAAGGSGYTRTVKGVLIETDVTYTIAIGSGGAPGADGGQTSGFGYTVSGGKKPVGSSGGSGGSGGGNLNGNGGSDGSDGKPGGTGQRTTTREFGEPDGKLYSGAGCGAWGGGVEFVPGSGGTTPKGDGKPNTGASGSCDKILAHPRSGGSGILIVRDPRGA